MTLKELLCKNKNNYIRMAKLKGKGARYVMCGCLTKSNTLPLSCIDNLEPGDCRSEGYEVNLKVLERAASLCAGIMEGKPKTSGATAIAYTHCSTWSSTGLAGTVKG